MSPGEFQVADLPAPLIHSALPSVARQLVVPQGFSLSVTGVFAILLEHRPHPGSAAIWLFVVGAALGFSIVVRASGAHRSGSALQPASGYQLFNLSPVVIVPAVSLIVWWIPLVPVAYALSGLSTSCGYLLAVASIFQAIRSAPR
jgi:hypothetical protein